MFYSRKETEHVFYSRRRVSRYVTAQGEWSGFLQKEESEQVRVLQQEESENVFYSRRRGNSCFTAGVE